jgi:hypothetical protein
MGRPRYPRDEGRVPPPLPPAERTVGQLVAESLRLYGRRFWAALLVGVGPASLGLAGMRLEGWTELVFSVTAGAVVLSAAFVLAVRVATGASGAPWLTALVAGTLVFAPFALLVQLLIVPGIVWLALVALAVPAIVVERLGLVAGLRRALRLAHADFVHALGAFALLWLVVLLAQSVLAFVLRDQGDQTLQAAVAIASLVVSPVFFLGGALLYYDNAARVVDSASRTRPRRRDDAHVHPALDPHAAGRADAEVEPRTATRGQP